MLSTDEKERYSRQIALPELGMEGQLKLQQARVLVIGAGGLGCPALQYLAAAGVGTLGVMDHDIVEASNLQRQILYSEEDIGKSKARTAQKKLSLINSFIQVNAYTEKLHSGNIEQVFTEYDIIVDGTDDLHLRYLINDACYAMQKPMVYASLHRFQAQVSVFHHPAHASLAPTYRCLFPDVPETTTQLTCEILGVPAFLPGMAGTLQAAEVIKLITGLGEPLSGRLLILDALSMKFTEMHFERNPDPAVPYPSTFDEIRSIDYHFTNDLAEVPEITAQELALQLGAGHTFTFVDVRNLNEQPQVPAWKSERIPLAEIDEQASRIPKDKIVIVYCQSGIRSVTAIEKLRKHFPFQNLYNLKGGIHAWMHQMQKTEHGE